VESFYESFSHIQFCFITVTSSIYLTVATSTKNQANFCASQLCWCKDAVRETNKITPDTNLSTTNLEAKLPAIV
jgi:hypothetical protein